MSFCKSLTQTKGPVEKEEKKEVAYELPKGAEVLQKKEDRDLFYYEPTARGKKGKAKPKKDESASKPIKHNAETFNLFDKLKLDAPITTDDVPPLVEKLEAKLVEYNEKVKGWEEKREDLKNRILAGEATAEDGKDGNDEEKDDEKDEEKDEEKEEGDEK